MKLTFKTKDVQELVQHAVRAKKHAGDIKGLMLVHGDGAYLVSMGLPKLKDGKNDDKHVFARRLGETGQIAIDHWRHQIDGAWLKWITALKTDEFTIFRRGRTLRMVSGDKVRDVEGEVPMNNDEPKTRKRQPKLRPIINKECGWYIICRDDIRWHVLSKSRDTESVQSFETIDQAREWCQNNPKQRSSGKRKAPEGMVSLATICEEVGIDTKKARIKLRKGKQKPAHGWSWSAEDAAAIKKFLSEGKVEKATTKSKKVVEKAKPKKAAKKKAAKKSAKRK